jgi:hypothetical protein
VGSATHTGERRAACRIFIEKQKGMKLLWRPMQMWAFITKVDLQKLGWVCRLKWCGSEQAQLAVPCKHGNEISGTVKYGEFPGWLAGKTLAS